MIPPLLILFAVIALLLAVFGFWKPPCSQVAVVLLCVIVLLFVYGHR